jgi:hypothetical protein
MLLESVRWPHILIFVVVGWFLLMALIARISGWKTLSDSYQAQSGFDGPKLRFKSASLRWSTNYGNCLFFGVNPQGVHISILVLFRYGHPDLFIPWTDISYTPGRKFWFNIVRFAFLKTPAIPFIVSERLAQRIFQARTEDR